MLNRRNLVWRSVRACAWPLIATIGLAGVADRSIADRITSLDELRGLKEIHKNLVIGTGEGSVGNEFESFNMSNVEIGADQEVVSNSDVGAPSQRVGTYSGGLDLTGTFVPNDGANAASGGNRWDDVDADHGSDIVGVPDRLPGARPVFEGIDFSGNVALTGQLAKFNSSDSDVNADIGIQCNRAPASCLPSPSDNNTYFDATDPNNPQNLNDLNGISQFNPADLIADLEMARDFIVSLQTETTITTDIENTNIKGGSGPFVTNLDTIDANNDGIAVINIDRNDSAFKVNNSDWILESAEDTIAIFRMADGVQFDFSNSSILLGDGTTDSTDVIDDLGAIFFMDADKGPNEVFNLNNVILGGIGLWDFVDFNPDRSTLLNSAASTFNAPLGDQTVVNLQDAQGCAQFISHQVLMSNNRWNRCALAMAMPPVVVPEPSTVLLLLLALPLMRLRPTS